MDKTRESLWHAHWQAAKADKLERRRQNREAWKNSAANVMNQRAAIVPEIAVDPVDDATETGSLARLRTIMADGNQPLHRRIDAAEVLVSFELAPGSASNVDPDQVAATSFQFLRAVVDKPATPEALRFRALKSVATIENSRSQSKNISVTHQSKRQLLINLVNAERVAVFRSAGVWPKVVKTDAWAVTLGDDLPWPAGWPGDWTWPPGAFAAELEHADREHNETFRTQLRAITAKNRLDDWERLLITD
jgi:hypothetical protein